MSTPSGYYQLEWVVWALHIYEGKPALWWLLNAEKPLQPVTGCKGWLDGTLIWRDLLPAGSTDNKSNPSSSTTLLVLQCTPENQQGADGIESHVVGPHRDHPEVQELGLYISLCSWHSHPHSTNLPNIELTKEINNCIDTVIAQISKVDNSALGKNLKLSVDAMGHLLKELIEKERRHTREREALLSRFISDVQKISDLRDVTFQSEGLVAEKLEELRSQVLDVSWSLIHSCILLTVL